MDFAALLVAAVLLGGAALAIFGPILFPEYPKTRPTESSLYGTYVPDVKAQAFIAAHYGAVQSSITLKPEGKCSFVSIPDCWQSIPGASKGSANSFIGEWEIVEKSHDLSIKKPGAYTGIDLIGQAPPYTLALYVQNKRDYLRYVRAPGG